MHPQLAAVLADLDAAQARLHRLADSASADAWIRRPGPGRWSAAECVAHLNLTARAFLPRLEAALAEGGRRAATAGRYRGRYRRRPLGWLVWRALAAPPRRLGRTRTGAAFVPPDVPAELDRALVVPAFDALQAELAACVRAGDGLPLHRLRLASPFAERVRYDVYAAFTILAVHEHRHLGQAERALAGR